MRTQQRFRSDKLVINTEIINKEALSNWDNKRLRTFDGITTYPIGTNPFKVCESEMKSKLKNLFKHNTIDKEKMNELNNQCIPLHY